MSKQIFIFGLYYILQASPPHHHTPNGNKIYSPQFANHSCFLFFLWYSPCKMRKELDNHLESCPGCADELGISCASNWAATLRLPSVTTSSKAINNYSFRVKTGAKLANKHLVEVMWHDEKAFNTESFMPDSPSKCLECSSAASIRGACRQLLYLN
jgi:hypothetical protein